MKTSSVVLLVISAIILILVIFIGYIGFFTSVKIKDKQEGGYKLVGKEFVGEYSKVGKLIMDVDQNLKNLGVTSTKGFGIYYDDPKKVPADKCRSFVGNILEEKDYNRMNELQSKGFKIDSIPVKNAIIAYFPIKTGLSYMVGPMKVYPEFSKYMVAKGYKSDKTIEIYDSENKQIEFIMQYDK